MRTLIESLSTVVILILIVLLLTHFLNGTATSWVTSKYKAA